MASVRATLKRTSTEHWLQTQNSSHGWRNARLPGAGGIWMSWSDQRFFWLLRPLLLSMATSFTLMAASARYFEAAASLATKLSERLRTVAPCSPGLLADLRRL